MRIRRSSRSFRAFPTLQTPDEMEQDRKDPVNRQPLGTDLTQAQPEEVVARDEPQSRESREASSLKGGADTEDNFIELITDTLEEIDSPVQGAFLQKFVKCLASVEVSESDSQAHWQEILRRRTELSALLNRPVSLRTAAVDYFDSAGLLKNPILLEYREFKRLRHSAATDPLTGFYNRRLFEDYLARELNRASRYSAPFALILIDLRGFKKVNDIYGHAVGDQVLRAVPRACTETIRGSDYPFRIGGDEFAVLLPQSDSRSAESLARRIAQKFEQYTKTVAPSAMVGLDYGIGSFPIDGATVASLFEAADRNLYVNKRNSYRQSDEHPSPSAGEGVPAEREEKAAESAGALPNSVLVMPTAVPIPTARNNQGGMDRASTPSDRDVPRRHHPRFPLEGSWSLGVVVVGSLTELVRILDISSGGVGLLVDETISLPEKFQARLNVPVFASSGLTLRRLYACKATQGKQRVGCSFDA